MEKDVLALHLVKVEKPPLPDAHGQAGGLDTPPINRDGTEVGDLGLWLVPASPSASTNLNAGAGSVGVADAGPAATNQLGQLPVNWHWAGTHVPGVSWPLSARAENEGETRVEPAKAAEKSTLSPVFSLPADASFAPAVAFARVESALSASASFATHRKLKHLLLSSDGGIDFDNIAGPYTPPVAHFPLAMTDTMVAVPGAPEAGFVQNIIYAIGFLANRPVAGVEGWLSISAIRPDGTIRGIANLPSTATTYPGDHSARLLFLAADPGVVYELMPGEVLAFQALAYKIYPDSTVRTDIFTLLPGDLGLSADLVTYVKNPGDGTYAPTPVFGVPGIAGEIAPIPEPEAGTLLLAGLALLAALRRFRSRDMRAGS